MQLKQRCDLPPHDPVREAEMLLRVLAHVTGPYSREQVSDIFDRVFRASRELTRHVQENA